MRTFLSTRGTLGRLVSRLIVCSLIAGQVVLPVQAAPTALADVPIAAKVSAKPNIVYTLDDSGSMQYNYLPDAVTSAGASIPLTGVVAASVGATLATGTPTSANVALRKRRGQFREAVEQERQEGRRRPRPGDRAVKIPFRNCFFHTTEDCRSVPPAATIETRRANTR